MKRLFLPALVIALASVQIAHAGDVRFAKYKFQPDKTYKIEIFHKNTMKFKFTDPDSSDAVPLDKVIPLENQVLFKATLRTYPVNDKHVIPVKMQLENFATLIKRGKKMVPQDESANNELKGKEFLGELDESGRISLVSGTSESGAVPAGDASVFALLDMIPDLPEGEHDVGSVFFMDREGRFVSPDKKSGAVAFIYTIAGVSGDDVHLDIAEGVRPDAAAIEAASPLTPGTTGEVTYSERNGICSHIKLNTISTSEPEKEELKSKGVVLSDRLFMIDISVVE